MLKLIKPPFRRNPLVHTSPMIFTVTGGAEYTTKELSELTGIHTRTIHGRISQLGWEHPDILAKVTKKTSYVKTFNADEALRELIASDKVCPIMQGSTNLRVTRNGWNKACTFHKERPTANNNRYPSNRYCAICDGKDIPDGVSFITKKELQTFAEGR